MSELSPQVHVDARVLAYYGSEFDEADRLVGRSGQGLLEFERTQQFVRERVPAGSRIIDIGGASGVHAQVLADRGDSVVLIDPVPEHVEAASRVGTFTARRGDARSLPEPDHSFDAALLLGPLYHLVDRRDRHLAWSETLRVVRPGGWVFAAAISRLSTTAWVTVIEPSIRRAREGQSSRRSPMPDQWRRLIEDGEGELGEVGFPGGHFHLADDLEQEARDAGLLDVTVVGLEGPGAQALEVARTHDPALIEAARALACAFDSQPGLRDLSPHLLAMGRPPAP